jgi:succinate dehydrogenase / fumarate reductase flavoprotein subunit
MKVAEWRRQDMAFFSTSRDAINRLGKDTIAERYGNLFDMYENIMGQNAYEQPMQIYPAPHYTMGGLWVDYNLMTTIPGLFAAGECNFSDHGANRLGASALMQGLADGYFVVHRTCLAITSPRRFPSEKPARRIPNSAAFTEVEQAVREKIDRMLVGQGQHQSAQHPY